MEQKSKTNVKQKSKNNLKQKGKLSDGKELSSATYKSNNKSKMLAIRIAIISFAAIALIGCIVGLVFLLRSPIDKNLELDRWMGRVDAENNTSPSVTEEVVTLPDGYSISNVVSLTDDYIVVKDVASDKEIICKRNGDAESIVSLVSFQSEELGNVIYDDVLSMYGHWAHIKNSTTNSTHFVDLESLKVVDSANNFSSAKFKNGFVCLETDENGYKAFKIIHLGSLTVALSVSTSSKVASVNFAEKYIDVKSETRQTYYDYKVEANSLKVLSDFEFVEKIVDGSYVLSNNEVEITIDGARTVIGAQSKILLATNKYYLIETCVPVENLEDCNFVDDDT